MTQSKAFDAFPLKICFTQINLAAPFESFINTGLNIQLIIRFNFISKIIHTGVKIVDENDSLINSKLP